MKKIIAIGIFLCIIIGANAQEKKIKFNKGVLKICTSSQMKITGYDGDEVIIKSLNNKARVLYGALGNSKKGLSTGYSYSIKGKSRDTVRFPRKDTILLKNFRVLSNSAKEKQLEKGLKPLGTKSTNPADNLYLDIEQKPGELIIKDYNSSDKKDNVFYVRNTYELLIPNTIKLLWNTDNCKKTTTNTYFTISSKPWELSNFKGEVEISSSFGSINLTDVSGPVLANTVAGNITVVFDKTTPKNLYSLISSDGHIDIQLPKSSSVKVDASGSRILSDIDFKIISENLIGDDTKVMNLELNGGKTKMKLNAGYGNIYLRKK
ncbi:hypothetical protein GTQ40_08775 [Flavobacteriaceae bacterium R38]|nr:hypothetical protein [Flavobacteriaceae bacterium R38]